METQKNIVIIGGGVMGECIASAILSAKNNWKVGVIGRNDNKTKIQNADVIILAVKPQSFLELAKEIKGFVPKNALCISVMVGITLASIKKELGVERVIRSMPNLGARILESMTVWTGTKNLTKIDKTFAEELFSLLGKNVYVKNEDMVDKATAVNGSGPGFMFSFIESYIEGAVKLGFSKKDATIFAKQVLKATNTLLQEKNTDVKTLREQVTSKGGTTEAGLKILMDKSFKNKISGALEKAYKRAKELSK
ncbi:MAG: pyrroline-5-carboxylate reductase [Patescibacteria group bacterium]